MAENPNPDEKTKTSFVSAKDAPQPPKAESQPMVIKVEGKEVHVLKSEIALTLIYGKMGALLDEFKAVHEIFLKAAGQSTATQSQNAETPTQAKTEPAKTLPEAKPTEVPPRIKEIMAAFDPVKTLLNFDTDKSTMFVLVKPAQFLGQENFRKVNDIVRSLGGKYISAGKDSHFEIPKAPQTKQ